MKQMHRTIALLGFLAVLFAAPAHADNKAVTDVLQNRYDLSKFRDALSKTGVDAELREDRQYTLFVPTNDAFAQLVPNPDACYALPACKKEVAEIVRDHIVPAKLPLETLALTDPGAPTLGPNLVHVVANDARHDVYRVNDNSVLRVHLGDTVLLYTIDGVIADEKQLAALHATEQGMGAPAAH